MGCPALTGDLDIFHGFTICKKPKNDGPVDVSFELKLDSGCLCSEQIHELAEDGGWILSAEVNETMLST